MTNTQAITNKIDNIPSSDSTENSSTVLKKKKSKKKQRRSSGIRKMPEGILNKPIMKKFWAQRYKLFSKFDEGILLDEGS